MLVNAGLVRERIVADDGFVTLHDHAGEMRDETAGRVDLTRVDTGRQTAENLGSHLQRHHDFFERSVAGAFAEAVDCAFDLACPGLDSGQ